MSPKVMALSIIAGTGGLIQLGLSISDLALLIDQGKKFGNFVRVRQNDSDLFDLLNEVPEAVLRRHGLVETHEMEKKWGRLGVVHQGKKLTGKIQPSQTGHPEVEDKKGRKKKDKPENVEGFTWVMVAIVSALDDCLTSSGIQELLIRVFVTVLTGDEETATALRVHLKVNIQSWRSFGCAREIAFSIKSDMRKSLKKFLPDSPQVMAISQLNGAETQDLERFLIWLLSGDQTIFNAMSAITFSIAEALKIAKLHLCTDGNPLYEGQACVVYHDQGQLPVFEGLGSNKLPILRGLSSRTLQISWPFDCPHTMIDTLGVGRPIENAMLMYWEYGKEAAYDLKLVGKADAPYEDTKEVYYSLEENCSQAPRKRFLPHISMLARQGFPVATQNIYEALEKLLEGEPVDSPLWLQNHVALDHLLRIENTHVTHEKEYMAVFSKYQALIFGFYYQLLKQILCFELVESTAFFHGIWGAQSTTFLAMCTQFSSCLLGSGQVSRAHMLYMLAAMYNGRRKVFNANSSVPQLVGVLGPISVVVLSLIRTTDIPEELWKIAIVDLPIVDLVSDSSDGELMASAGGGINFVLASESGRAAAVVLPAGPTKSWTVHPSMSMLLGSEKSSGVVMAARCGGRLVGWFNPLVADILFLSSAYLREAHGEGDVVAFEVRDEDWQSAQIQRPDENRVRYQFGIVRSRNCPALRYAAAGFYGEMGEEVVIARSEVEVYGAFGRIEAQEQGMIIA
jgi:hypothetical protein